MFGSFAQSLTAHGIGAVDVTSGLLLLALIGAEAASRHRLVWRR